MQEPPLNKPETKDQTEDGGVSGEAFSAFTDTLLVVGCGLVADHSFHAEQREAHSTALEMVVEPEGQPASGSFCSIFYT